jgi:hypothetical protein
MRPTGPPDEPPLRIGLNETGFDGSSPAFGRPGTPELVTHEARGNPHASTIPRNPDGVLLYAVLLYAVFLIK